MKSAARRVLFAAATAACSLFVSAPAASAQDAPPAKAQRQPATQPARPQTVNVPVDAPAFQGRFAAPGALSVRVVPPEDVAQQVSCVLQVEADGTYNPYAGGTGGVDARTAAGILRSTPVLHAAVTKALGKAPASQRLQDWLVVNAVPTAPRHLEVEVILLKGGGGPEAVDEKSAAALLSALCETLEGALREAAEGQRASNEKRRQRVEQEAAAARQRLDEVRAKVRRYRAETSALGHSGDVRYTLQNLRTQRQQHEQQLANYRSRLRQIEPSASPLAAEWGSIVELRQKQLEEARAQQAAGKATAEQVAAQERRLNEARSQLETHRRAAESDPTNRHRGGELASLQHNIATTESQLKTVNDQLAKLEDEKVQQMLEELPELQNEENRARNEVAEVTNRYEQLRRTTEVVGDVTVRVLDGQPDE